MALETRRGFFESERENQIPGTFCKRSEAIPSGG
jgi:hypothetical protein